MRCALGLVLVVTSLFAAKANGAEPFLEKVDLFEARQEGYELYRIPGIVVAKSGTVLAYCEARKSAASDWGPIDILLRRSTDGGRTWLPRQTLVHVEGDLPPNPLAVAQKLDKPGDNTANNPVAIVDHQTGAIHFLYCLEYMRCFYMSSTDDGATWSEAVEITPIFEGFRPQYDWKVLATGPGHATQLQRGAHAGRIVVPVWLSLGTGGHAHRPSVTATIYSDDHGKSWHAGAIAVPDTRDWVNPNETHIVELADGSVLLNSRSESPTQRRLITTSSTGIGDWSTPRFDLQLAEPICMAGLVRVRWPSDDDGGCIAFSNPDNLAQNGKEVPGRGRDRVNVSIQLSDDDGATWSAHRVLEPGFSGYSDLAVLPDRNTLLCFYERGSTDGKNIYRTGKLTVARFNEEWVRAAETDSPVNTEEPLKTLAHVYGLADGPSWDGTNTLYFPDVKGEKLFSWRRFYAGGQTTLEQLQDEQLQAGRISASFWRNGRLYLSDNGNGLIAIWNRDGNELLHQFDQSEQPAPKPNDLVVDRHGGVYVTLTSQNRVAYITADKQAKTAVSDIISPNGLILSPDEKTLYVAAYNPKEIWAYPVTGMGSVGDGRKFAVMDDGEAKGADGMTIDSQGNVYCAGATEVWIWNADGTLLTRLACPTRPINCTFGAPDLKSLYITGFGGLYRQRMHVRGLSW